ncbi:MAG: uL15 family ribosomal protein [Candidatus Hodarchaeales archaeon]|jgi:large subunit ribosomal protein L15
MVIRRDKKIRKQRGSRTYGYGRISGGHRKSGARGGVGASGRFKHLLIKHIKAGTAGRRSTQIVGRGFIRKENLYKKEKTWNIETINQYISNQIIAKKEVKELNLADFGIKKLLGKGSITYPVTVTVKQATENAINKIEKAGGKCVVASKD